MFTPHKSKQYPHIVSFNSTPPQINLLADKLRAQVQVSNISFCRAEQGRKKLKRPVKVTPQRDDRVTQKSPLIPSSAVAETATQCSSKSPVLSNDTQARR